MLRCVHLFVYFVAEKGLNEENLTYEIFAFLSFVKNKRMNIQFSVKNNILQKEETEQGEKRFDGNW